MFDSERPIGVVLREHIQQQQQKGLPVLEDLLIGSVWMMNH